MHLIPLFEHLWQSSLVGLAILGLMFVATRIPARTRWMLGWVAILKFALPLAWFSSVPFVVSGATQPHSTASAFATAVVHATSVATSDLKLPANLLSRSMAMTERVPLRSILMAIWILGSCVFLGRWIARGVSFRRNILSNAQPLSPTIAARLVSAVTRVGSMAMPRSLTVRGLEGPGVLGIISPIVVLPETLDSELSPAEMESILIHEVVHLQRRDTLWAALQALFVSMFWFNPVVWMLSRKMSIEAEKACDERVLELTADPKNYANGLIKTVRYAFRLQRPGFAGAATMPVLSRVKNILAHRAYAPFWVKWAVVGTAIALVAFTSVTTTAVAKEAGGFSGKILVFRNIPSWNRNPDFEDVLRTMGYQFEVKKSSDMAGADLSAYAIIVIPGAQWKTGYYDEFARAGGRFDEYVKNGGVLLAELNGAEREGITMPGGAKMVAHGAFDNLIVMPGHPALKPLEGKPRINANVASHGYLEGVPTSALVLAVEMAAFAASPDLTKPTYVEYQYGKGRVIAACQCFHDRDNSGRGPLMPAELQYAAAGKWYSPLTSN